MRSIRLVKVLPLILVLACGSNNKAAPDAHVIVDDSQPIDNPPPPPGCDYGELNDSGNDYNATPTPGVAEQTQVVFASGMVMCGKINNGHYVAGDQRVDIDSFLFSVTTQADVLATMSAAGAEALDQVAFYIYDTAQAATVFSGTFVGDHAVGIGNLPPGTYELDMEAYAAADAAAPIDYKVKMVNDTPATRCPKVTAATNYTEANDGGASTGNDMVNIDYNAAAPTPAVTLTAAADAPELTGLTLAAGTNYRITGTNATRVLLGSYLDRDTFKITTGPTTNQMSVRLNWPGTTADLDYYVFNETTTVDIASGIVTGNAEDEFALFAVKPNTSYWLWVGMYDMSTAPVTYDASLCPETFTP